MIEILPDTSPIAAALLALLAGALSGIIARLITNPLREKRRATRYGERLVELTATLTRSSRELDNAAHDLAEVARERGMALKNLEAELAVLQQREQETKDRIQALEKTPLPVAEHFARLLEPGERRSVQRDFLLFGLGVVVTTVISLII